MYQVVLVRHGESVYNRQNLFTGWTDVDLTEQGTHEAIEAGRILKEAGYTFDLAFASVLKRSIRTLYHILDELDHLWIPVQKSWKLNERHYGALQGLSKLDSAVEYGEEQVHIWRRSLTVRPPCWLRKTSGVRIGKSVIAILSQKSCRLGKVWRTQCIGSASFGSSGLYL